MYEFQDDAVEAIYGSDVDRYLAFDAGLGKTKVACDLAQKRGVRRMLVFCPQSALPTWRREIDLWWLGHPAVQILHAQSAVHLTDPDGIFLVSYGLMSLAREDLVNALRVAPSMDLTVFDEAHWLKSTAANRTKNVLRELRSIWGRALPMSATPAPNHAERFRILW